MVAVLGSSAPDVVLGRRHARRAFGHSLDRAQVVQAEADAIREAARRVLAGETLSQIVADWNERGMRTTAGGPWRINALSSLLVQPRLAGGEEAGGDRPAPPPIIDRLTYDRLLALHASRRKPGRRPPRRYLLTGFLRCGRCGQRLWGMAKQAQGELYVCPSPGHGGCSGVMVKSTAAEEMVRDMVVARVDTPEFAEAVTAQQQWLQEHGADVQGVADAVRELQDRLEQLPGLWASGELSRPQWQQVKAELDRRVESGQAHLARLLSVGPRLDLAGRGHHIRTRWDGMGRQERRDLIALVLDHVVVLPVRRRHSSFQPGRLQPVWRS